MWQQILTAVLIAGAAAWLGRSIWRFFRPHAGGGCAGGCGCGAEKKTTPPPAAGSTVFFSADDLARRVRARR